MNTVTESRRKLVEDEAMRCLAGGLDTPKMDEFLDQLFQLARELGKTWFYMASGNRVLALNATFVPNGEEYPRQVLALLEVPRPKTKIRMLCARLAVRCTEWAGREVFAYGDTLEFVHPTIKKTCKVQFANTTAIQELSIEFPVATDNATACQLH